VRISRASPEADLSATVWPGVSTIYYPRVESAEEIQQVDAIVSRLEKLRGIRPGTIEIRPLVESPAGVSMADKIGSSSARIQALGAGPGLHEALGDDALAYAISEVELHARALSLAPVDISYVLD
jgi:citrate lyase subunit beta/citryl-CoA lyase